LVKALQRGHARQWQGSGELGVDALRAPRDGFSQGRRVLGEGALAPAPLANATKDLIAHLPFARALADRVHSAGEVQSRNQREVVLHHVLVEALDGTEVGRVRARHRDAHADLAGLGLGIRQFTD